MVIGPREVDQSVTWSGNHHRPSVAGCVACDWNGQLNKIKRIEPHTYVPFSRPGGAKRYVLGPN